MDFFESFSFFSLIFTLIIVIIIILLCIQLTNFLLNLTADKVTIDATLISKDSAKNYHYNAMVEHGQLLLVLHLKQLMVKELF